jgi:ABC-type Na+ efflux pump permease subunit
MGEFAMQSLNVVVKELKDNYKGNETLYEETANALNDAMIVAANAESKATAISNALDNLQAKYDALKGAYTTDIEGVEVNAGKKQGIYDISGRRVLNITTPGLYIIDGEKQLVK